MNDGLLLDMTSRHPSGGAISRSLLNSEVKHVHLVGIGGIGLSAIARVLYAAGYVVSGSDARQTDLTAQLAALGMTIHHGHRPNNVAGADLVIASSAVPPDNPEIMAARAAGLRVVKRGPVLGTMMKRTFGIAVAGTHGKTTTSALIAFVLAQMGLDPTFIVGGILRDMNTNAQLGDGPHFVLEADEYDYTFLDLRPRVAVVTVIEMDHPDCFRDLNEMTRAFERFLQLLPDGGTAVGCADHATVREVTQRAGQTQNIGIVTYGLEGEGTWGAQEVQPNALGGSDFVVLYKGQRVGTGSLCLPGRHNVSNALAALAVVDCLGLNVRHAMEVLPRFHGVQRRFELKGQARDVVVIDDYAHHPTEIEATLAAARQRYGARPLWVFFQPHTFSRTKALLSEFAASFSDADHVLISEVYAAREKDNLGVTGADLVQLMGHPDVRFTPTLPQAIAYLQAALRPGDILLTLGAGDGYLVGEGVLRALTDGGRRSSELNEDEACAGTPVE